MSVCVCICVRIKMSDYSPPEGSRTGAMGVSFTHRLLNTHVTALSVRQDLVFVGEGQHCHAHDVVSGQQIHSSQVFRAAVVHGFRIQPSPVEDGSSPSCLLLVFGQKSLAVLLFHATHRKFFVLMEERSVEDWIVDAGLEKDLSHIVVATGHNSMLRCKIPDLAQRCKTIFEQTSSNDSSTLLAGQPHMHLPQAGHKSVAGSGVERGLHQPAGNGGLTVVAQAACVERCVLFSGHLVMPSGHWESAVMLAGTMALQVLVWGPWATRNSEGSTLPLHSLLGHQGSIFSITFCPHQGLIATTSDDRSLRVWQVKPETEAYVLPCASPEEEREYWRSATITQKFASYGHRARVWRSLILPSWVVSVGEDSMVCVWQHSGVLAASWRAHDGANIWSVAACEDPSGQLVTGGSDGSVKSWCLSTMSTPVTAEPMGELPWSASVPAPTEECLDTERCSRWGSESGDNGVTSKHGEVECDATESCKLFKDSPVSTPPLRKELSLSSAAAADFPRCISVLGEGVVLVVTNSGRVYSYRPEASWCLEYEDKRLRNYAILEASPDTRHVAVGTLSGAVIILQVVTEEGYVKHEVEVEGSAGKVFALVWLTTDRILALGTAGLMTTWEIQNKGAAHCVGTHHLPVSMHRWLCAVYVPPTPAPPAPLAPQHLVCGDRAGSLHLYTLHEAEVQHSLPGLHGRNGVASLLCRPDGVVYSSGRDGYVRSCRVCEGRLLPLTVTRVCGASWVSRLVIVQGKLLAVCFHGVKLKLWSMGEEQSLLEVECGGAHRSWDLQVCGVQGWLACAFLKDGLPYTFTASLAKKLQPLIRPALNTQETMSLRVLYQCHGEALIVTAGEDTTLRLHAVQQQGQRQALGVMRSHLSGVRALCLIEGEGTDADKNDSGAVWLVSVGGRAEFKVWQCSVNDLSKTARDTDCNLRSGGQCIPKPSLQHSMESNPSSLQPQSVTLREVGSHMLRTGSHKTWKSQHPTLDPETRYMGVTSFWVSVSQALLALASSDGFLRIFLFLSECEQLREVCAVECGSCVLMVAQLRLPTRHILVTCSTRGHVIFWDLQAVVEWSLLHTLPQDLSHEPPQSPQPQELTRVLTHQSGVNALALHHHTDDPRHTTMATGGDDNKISVWKVVVREDDVTVTHQCSVWGHASQVSGLSWLSRIFLISASIDQRLIVWKLCSKRNDGMVPSDASTLNKTKQEDAIQEHHLVPVGSCFTGVPDTKGIVVTDVRDSEEGHKSQVADKRVFVYGMGLEVFDVSVGRL